MADLRLDDTGFGGIEIYQDPDKFCYGVDAVLLAGFAADGMASVKRSMRSVIDLGTGNGIVPLILSHKTDAEDIRGIELLEENAGLARKSVEHNGLSGRIRIITGDIAEILKDPGDLSGSFDAVTANPPYTGKSAGLTASGTARQLARQESTAGIREFIGLAKVLLRDRGDLYMVHRPARLVDIISAGRELGMEPKRMRLVSGKPGAEPNIVLIHFVKGGGAELKVLPQMHTREHDGSFSEELLKIYERR